MPSWRLCFTLDHEDTSTTYCASYLGVYTIQLVVVQGTQVCISTIYPCVSNRIISNGIRVFFIQNWYIPGVSNTKIIPFFSSKYVRYINHCWCCWGVRAISTWKHTLSVHTLGIFGRDKKYPIPHTLPINRTILTIRDLYLFFFINSL